MILKDLLFKNSGTKQILLKNTFWLGFSEVFAKLILFLVTIIIIRYLGTSEYGKYSFAVAFASLFGVFMDFGLNQLASREIAKGHKLSEKIIENMLGMKLVLAGVSIILTFIAIFFFRKSPDVVNLVYLAGIYTAIQGIVVFFPSIYAGYEKMEYNFIVRVGANVILLVLVALVVFSKIGSSGIFLAYIFDAVILLALSLYLLRTKFFKFKIRFDLSTWKDITKDAWPLFAIAACTTIYTNFDSTLLGISKSYREVGLYQSAYKLLYVFQTINLLHFVLFPRLTVLYHQKKHDEFNKLFRKLLVYSAALLVPGAVFFTLLNQPIIKLVYGSRYLEAGMPMVILVWGAAVGFFVMLFSNVLIVQNFQKKVFLATLIGTVLNIVTNFYTIPHFGPVGAALSFLVSQIVILSGIVIGISQQK